MERLPGPLDRLPRGVPVEIPVRRKCPLVPLVAGQVPIDVVDEIAFEGHLLVLLGAAQRDLVADPEGEDVVAHDVVAAIVECVAAGLAVPGDVVLKQHRRAGLVLVEGGSPVLVAVQIVNEVVAKNGAGGNP